MSKSKWTAAEIPDQRGRTAVVTGGNTGIGFETARLLAKAGATVVLACRNDEKATAAAELIRTEFPDAPLSTVNLNLASLESVRAASEKLRANHERIDLLINNAGTASVQRELSPDGFESVFATNHLGPFAFTGLLLDRVVAVPGARVVTVGSTSHEFGVIDVEDLNFEHRKYSKWSSYAQSKLANLMFAFELQRRLAAAGSPALSVAAHPGAADTGFGNEMGGIVGLLAKPALRPLVSWMLQTAEGGALPTVRAAVDPAVAGGEFYGPPGRIGLKGKPIRAKAAERAYDTDVQTALWAECERLTGVTFPC